MDNTHLPVWKGLPKTLKHRALTMIRNKILDYKQGPELFNVRGFPSPSSWLIQVDKKEIKQVWQDCPVWTNKEPLTKF